MTTNFESYLLGHYCNKSQAQSNPTEYSSVCILWEKIDGGYRSRNYYRVDGLDKPYRHRKHKVVEVSETEVIVENYNLDWTRQEGCDMIFTFKDNAWHGKLKNPGQCLVRDGVYVVAEIHLTKTGLDSRDQGFDSNDELAFGSFRMYKFLRGRIAQR
tara:strand:- start:1038 stop:1508 length:471 start_codon:yes stop_codon:yes gene_type:complete